MIRFSVVVCLILDVVTQISKANLTGKGIAELGLDLSLSVLGFLPLNFHPLLPKT